MAKKTIAGGIFAKTESKDKPEGDNKPYGVYLNKPMRADLAKIADETGMNNHALLQFAVKYFIQQYKTGKIKATKKTINTLEV